MMTSLQHESYGVNKIYDCQAKGTSLLDQNTLYNMLLLQDREAVGRTSSILPSLSPLASP